VSAVGDAGEWMDKVHTLLGVLLVSSVLWIYAKGGGVSCGGNDQGMR